MKQILFFSIFVLLLAKGIAQPPNRRAERIEALKVAFITQNLKLTAEEAQKFWPVYNSFIDELRKTKQTHREDELKFQEEALAIKKKYKVEFKKILGDDARVNSVFRLEAEFRAEVQKEIQRRMDNRMQDKKRQGPPPPTE
jgi:hypothetical protein